MAYIGKTPVIGNFVKLDAISVVNGQAAYTMQNGGVNFTDYTTVNQFLVSLNGTIQAATDSFTVSGSTITFASNLSTGDVIDFIIVFGNSLSAGTVSDSAITTAKLGANSVTAAKLNNDIISGTTALTSEPADTDEFLVSDAGTLKRIDYSLIKAGGMVKLFSSTPTNVSTIDINGYFTSDYDAYIIYAQNYYGVSTGGYLRIRGMVSGSAVTSSDYYTSAKGKYSQSGSSGDIDEAGWNDNKMRLEGNKGGSYTYSGSSTITIYNPLSTSMAKIITQFSSGFRNTTQYESVIGGGTLNTTSALSGVQLAWNSGNVTMSKLAMYGVKV